MPAQLRIADLAERDLDEGFAFYEARQPGLGDYFLDSLSADLDSLVLYAGIHRKIGGMHRLLSLRFPFAIYYTSDEHFIDIWAILDCRRNPLWIKRRLARSKKRR